METSVACPKCGRSFRVPPDLLGQRVRCLGCQQVFVARAPGPPPETALQTRPVVWAKARLVPEEPPEEEEDDRPRRARQRAGPTDHGVPGYLWPLVLLPWGILALTLGGCIWGAVAAGASAAGAALARARRVPVPA